MIPHEDWREAVATLTRAVADDRGPLLLQAGFVEQADGRNEEGSAVLAPLRSPGHSFPDVAVTALPYSWDSAAASSQRTEVIEPLLLGGRPAYLLSGGGYPTLFRRWVGDRFTGVVEFSPLGNFVAVELVKCQGSLALQGWR